MKNQQRIGATMKSNLIDPEIDVRIQNIRELVLLLTKGMKTIESFFAVAKRIEAEGSKRKGMKLN